METPEYSPRRNGALVILGRVSAVIMMAALMVSVCLILSQDIQIFPGVLRGLRGTLLHPPADVAAFEIRTSDGETLPAWRRTPDSSPRPQVALFLHGNGDTLESSIGVQRWLAQLGYTNYAVTYRGFPGSSGFPSEVGIERDATAALEFILRHERIEPREVIVIGNSIGTGPATYLAAQFGVGTLVLIAPYTSIPDVVRARGVLALLTPFLWYTIPSLERIGTLREICLVLAHGKKDTVIEFEHSVRLLKAYRGSGTATLLSRDNADHFNILGAVFEELGATIDRCVSTRHLKQ
jgi:hypothetical protein